MHPLKWNGLIFTALTKGYTQAPCLATSIVSACLKFDKKIILGHGRFWLVVFVEMRLRRFLRLFILKIHKERILHLSTILSTLLFAHDQSTIYSIFFQSRPWLGLRKRKLEEGFWYAHKKYSRPDMSEYSYKIATNFFTVRRDYDPSLYSIPFLNILHLKKIFNPFLIKNVIRGLSSPTCLKSHQLSASQFKEGFDPPLTFTSLVVPLKNLDPLFYNWAF